MNGASINTLIFKNFNASNMNKEINIRIMLIGCFEKEPLITSTTATTSQCSYVDGMSDEVYVKNSDVKLVINDISHNIGDKIRYDQQGASFYATGNEEIIITFDEEIEMDRIIIGDESNIKYFSLVYKSGTDYSINYGVSIFLIKIL